MNFDELMAVWKSQDAAPLHDVNKTLLHQALQRDEAELQKVRRIAKRINLYLHEEGLYNSQEPTPRGKRMAKKWIAGAVKKPGALHEDLGVPQGKKIPVAKVAAAAKKPGKIGQRARLAQTLGKMRK